VEFNILSVVTGLTARHTERVYNFFKRHDFDYIQFIPCIDNFGSEERTLAPELYGQFLRRLFDLWYNDWRRGRRISVRYFDNLLSMMAGYPPEQCSLSGVCGISLVVEADGGVYPCDFYTLDEWRLGSVYADSYEDMRVSPAAKVFVEASARGRENCAGCRWFRLCRGGCQRDREPLTGGDHAAYRFCEATKDFLNYTAPRLWEMCAYLLRMGGVECSY